MSRSPRRVQADDWGDLVSETRRETHFKFGKSDLPVTDADLGRVGTLAERLFGAKVRWWQWRWARGGEGLIQSCRALWMWPLVLLWESRRVDAKWRGGKAPWSSAARNVPRCLRSRYARVRCCRALGAHRDVGTLN